MLCMRFFWNSKLPQSLWTSSWIEGHCGVLSSSDHVKSFPSSRSKRDSLCSKHAPLRMKATGLQIQTGQCCHTCGNPHRNLLAGTWSGFYHRWFKTSTGSLRKNKKINKYIKGEAKGRFMPSENIECLLLNTPADKRSSLIISMHSFSVSQERKTPHPRPKP